MVEVEQTLKPAMSEHVLVRPQRTTETLRDLHMDLDLNIFISFF